ncbi:MAG: hypothetical protein IKU02_05485 [Bacteroidaceae bacterium]|nr:hypothetical protein [Bacteroidaceae bacterium]
MKKIYMTMVALLCSAAAMAQMTLSADNVAATAGETAYIEIKFAETEVGVITAASCRVTLPEGFTIAQIWDDDEEAYLPDVEYPAAKKAHNCGMLVVTSEDADPNTYQFSAAHNESTFKTSTDVMFKIGVAVPEGTAKGNYPVKVTKIGFSNAAAEATAQDDFSFEIEVGGTGINSINADDSKAPVYNMAGQRVGKAQQGVFIQNGKKVAVK